MLRICFVPQVLFLGLFCAINLPFAIAARTSEPKWIRVSSSHFAVLTDAGEKKGREVSLRLEQMRDIFSQLFSKTKLRLPEPLDVITLKSDEEYIRVAPLRQGRPTSAAGFFLPGEDRNYIVLDLSADESWRAVAREFARLMLTFNYPPTQDWFDEGFAQYFSSLRLQENQAQIGGLPEQNLPWEQGFPGQASGASNPAKSFVELLNHQWLTLPNLFTMQAGEQGYPPIFYAESWIVMHYFLSKNKLSDAGTYFGLVKIQRVSLEQAIRQAFGMTAIQLEQAVKEHFQSLAPQWQAQENAPATVKVGSPNSAHQSLAVISANDIGNSVQDIPEAQAQALVAEMEVRLAEHREQGEKDLRTIISDPKGDNSIAHRGLAWTHMEKKEFDQAGEELIRAAQLDARDTWTRYYLALAKFRAAQSSRNPIQGVSNMIQDLIAVVDWDPDFAEAHNMLAMARLQGGGVHSALESIRVAIQLSPRNEHYLLNLAQINLAGKKWDDATALLDRLKDSSNLQIAQAARKHLEDLPTLKKYGVLPEPSGSQPPQSLSTTSATTGAQGTPADIGEKSSSDQNETITKEPVPDKRKVQYLRGRLMSVDCSQSPAAILTVKTGSRTIQLRTDNYKSLLMVGADEFSCDWANRPVVVNYKAGGKADGDLVSVEVQ